MRQAAASSVTAGLAPGLRTRAFIFNPLLNDKAIDDRMRSYPSWISSRNLANEASDERVVEVVVSADNTPFLIGQRVLVKFMKRGEKAGAKRAGDGPGSRPAA